MQCKTITEYLKRSNKTQAALAGELGISQPHLNDIKSRRRRPSPKLAAKIESVTGIPFKKLLLSSMAIASLASWSHGQDAPKFPTKLEIAYIASAAADIASGIAVRDHAREANPVMGQSVAQQVAVKTSTTAAVLYLSRKIHNTWARRSILIGGIAIQTWAAQRNWRLR